MIERYIVTIEHPDGVSINEMKNYIYLSVRQSNGGMDPEEPLYDLNRRSVKVKHQGRTILDTWIKDHSITIIYKEQVFAMIIVNGKPLEGMGKTVIEAIEDLSRKLAKQMVKKIKEDTNGT